MIESRMATFYFLFCFILHKSEILDAQSTAPNINNVCSTPACKFDASIILQYMDPKAAPCDDFNKFACGTFLKNTTIPKDRPRVDRYDIIFRQIQEQVKVILEEKTQPNEQRWATLTKNFYKSCTNTAAIEKNGIRGVLGDVKALNGWPVLENSWNETKFEWKQSTYNMLKLGYGSSYFFTFQVMIDFYTDSKKNMINIDQPPFSIDREILVKGLNDTLVTAYYNYMVEMAVYFGANRDKAKNELKESLQFEIDLASISKSEADRSNEALLNNRMTVTDLQKKYASIPWKVYFQSHFSVLNSSIVIGGNETIIVGVPTFFENFEKLIKRAPKRVQANYHVWRAVQDDFDLLTAEIRNRKLKFTNILNGPGKIKDRRQDCLDQTLATYLKLGIGALYVRKHFNPATKKSAEVLAVDIQKQFKKIIQEAKWMDAKTRTNALNKLASMKNYIGYPDEFLDDKTLNEFFKKAEVNPNDFFQSASAMSYFLFDYNFNKLRNPVNGSDWTLHGEIATVAPFFSLDGNGIEIPAGLLQDIFFTKDGPQYLNYAGVGSFNVGHETTHVFDNLDTWLTPETKKTYLANADCITKQYGSYIAEGVNLKLNGAFTRTENIADNTGVKAAYLAYQEWAKGKAPEPKLPGLTNYSLSQLFWIHAAIQQCDKYTLEFLKRIVQGDIHSPSGFRIIGAFSNRLEFARDFNCSLGSKMNPVKKCSVW